MEKPFQELKIEEDDDLVIELKDSYTNGWIFLEPEEI